MQMPVNFKLRAIESERAPSVMCFHDSALKHGQGKQTEFTIDFTSYKVLVIMLMAFMFTLVICSTFSMLLNVNIPTYPVLD